MNELSNRRSSCVLQEDREEEGGPGEHAADQQPPQVQEGEGDLPPALSVRAILLIQVSKQFSTLPKPFSFKGFLASFSSFIKGQS